MRTTAKTVGRPVVIPLDVKKQSIHWGTVPLVAGLLIFLCLIGLRSSAQAVAGAVVLWTMASWICRRAGSTYLAIGVIGARIATVLVAAMIIEPHYLSATGADVEMYRAFGKEMAGALWHGHWMATGEAWGTAAYIDFTGICYFLFGLSPLIMRFVSAGAGAIGSILFYQGFLQYYKRKSKLLLLLLFWPSLVYWSSIEGKDPWNFLLLALGFWGISKVFADRFRAGLGACSVASAGLFFLRPHIAVLYLGAAGCSLLFHRRSESRHRMSKVFAVGILLAATTCATFVQSTWTGPGVATSEIPYQLSARLEGLNTGGSAIAVPVFNGWRSMAAYMPLGAVTVLFRPFPWDAGDSFLEISSVDQLALTAVIFLGAAMAFSLLRKKGLGAIGQDRMTLFLVAYCVGFVFVMLFVSANLGTLVREKIQLFPFALCAAVALRIRADDSAVRESR